MDIQWHEDGMAFETMREAHEWAYNVIYNEIGYLYDGYKTKDEKIASSLIYELVRANTLCGPKYNIFCDEECTMKPCIYKVWVTLI
ncbi:hypothetical protein F8160_02020 [Bacillus sp. CH126_4D]|uniref:hypothetical protein n=1 Tax=unclassified Bacillus (in: firmicutes) TaxID=185979 RepID=UPI00124BCEED|nr:MULTISPECIES: hypothetical protein [unclassified Bacillus (in: firmicutes)]KAB2458210.1 hypothetical protein F8162_08225 [Bacillus sp. CH140a_4T]KAB2475074.1 hypothetical protein F8160_02020 [Bacillus sp. CH126_4D]